jgi:hypothetical protein
MFYVKYGHTGYWDGMTKPPYEKINILLSRDKWGFESFFTSTEAAQQAFDYRALRHKRATMEGLFTPLRLIEIACI